MISIFNRALNAIPKRADQQQVEELRRTFEDSGVTVALETIDNQVMYGRRGTGKTHAFRYLETQVLELGDIPVYVDLRQIGSANGLFNGNEVKTTERAARLLVDLLGNVRDHIFEIVVNDEDLVNNPSIVDNLDRLVDAISKVRIVGPVNVGVESSRTNSIVSNENLSLGASSNPALSYSSASQHEVGSSGRSTMAREGDEEVFLEFSPIVNALRSFAGNLGKRRLWILLDEWSSVPSDLQPLLGEFIVRGLSPVSAITVKIAAIEQQSNFRDYCGDQLVGIELGADFAANLNLDDYMVYEQHEERSTSFFKGLFHKHLMSGRGGGLLSDRVLREEEMISQLFSDRRAFEELVRASEGVPRDALNIAGKAALSAGGKKISMKDVRSAARSWYQADKENALQSDSDATRMLHRIVDDVIREKKSRGFLVNQRDSNNPVLLKLFDARVLHIVRRGYSAQDVPGERFDVWTIDYGAYVDLIRTQNEPRSFLPGGDEGDLEAEIDVPMQDLRAIRRAILDLDALSKDK
ncbi:hypothetical protein MANAM107_03080 [Actinomyces capricornis]|uniref:ATP-binding protein n=1 Tax=Actinomyces capricornis TaxID=2755559 RepID=A0ABN6K5X0_9ACTO|nr:hypothetical protein MANAM107_03080 [Actinomyces capricornis]